MNKCINCKKTLSKIQITKHNNFCCKACATLYRCKAHDPNIFLIEDKDILYYLLGLIFTDGNLNKEETRITLSLTQKDIIEKLYPLFSDTNKRKIYEYTPKNTKNANTVYTIINSNIEVINNLKMMTLTSNNSVTKEFPKISKKYMNSFLRGVFDGDGCIFNSNYYKEKCYKKISITCASDDFTLGLYFILYSLGLYPTITSDTRRENNEIQTYYICLNRQNDVFSFYNYIYNNAKIYMTYKKQRFEKYSLN